MLEVLDKDKYKIVEVAGYTSSEGPIENSDEYNCKLSWRRAKWVVFYLINRLSLKLPEEILIKSKGYGATKFIYNENWEEDKISSRRIEFHIDDADGSDRKPCPEPQQ